MAQPHGEEISNKDIRLQIALIMEQEGVKLQAIQEKEGIEVAHHFFNKTVEENFKTLSSSTASLIEMMSEEEASTNIEMVKKYFTNSDEKIASILYDSGLSNKQKMSFLQNNQSYSKFEIAIQEIQGRAEIVGYEKLFKEISDQFRSRYVYVGDPYGALGDPVDLTDELGVIAIVALVTAGVLIFGSPSSVSVLKILLICFVLRQIELHT